MKLPLAKNNDIIQQESGNELLLYKLDSNQAYCLNSTSTIIYQHCNGKTEVEEISRKYGMNEEIILLALQKFETENLLAGQTEFRTIPRRQLLIKAATSAVALPFISMIVAPSATQAASACINPNGAPPNTSLGACFGNAVTCVNPCQTLSNQCCSGTTYVGFCDAQQNLCLCHCG